MALTTKLVSQTGPKGFAGAQIRYGSGAPNTYTTANESDLYFDTTNKIWYGPRTGGQWPTLIASTAGFQGQQGTYTLGQSALNTALTGGAGPQAGLSPFTRITAATSLPVLGATTTCDYVPAADISLHSAFIQNASGGAGSLTFSLYDTTTGQSVYNTSPLAAGSSSFVGVLSAGSVPLYGGRKYQWFASPSAAGNYSCCVSPNYYEVSQAGACLNRAVPACIPSGVNVPNSSTALYIPGGNNLNAFIRPYAVGFLYSGRIVNNTAATALCTLNSYNISVGANSVSTFGPLGMTTCPLGVGLSNWVVSGSGLGGIVIDSWYVC